MQLDLENKRVIVTGGAQGIGEAVVRAFAAEGAVTFRRADISDRDQVDAVGLTAEPNNATYRATKGAVHSWTRSIARDWGPNGIRVNAVLPYVVTPMYEEFRDVLSPEELAAHDKQTAEQIPLGGKFGDPATQLAPVMVFLASDASRFMTGQLVPVDGGFISVR
jgi:NAD(P)-dependent dehydrogenase (short-subunit alcohol dehydrogenase family)